MSEMLSGKLRDFCVSVDYGYTASASTIPLGAKFLRITDIVPGHIDWDSVPYCDVDDKTFAKYRLAEGDIVIARTGATTGASMFINQAPNAIFASYLIRLKTSSVLNSKYLYYWLNSDIFKNYVYSVMSEKAAQPNASATTLTNVPITLPPLPVQREIAHILGSLDDKIDLNRRMNATLESMARALFKSWFVDFDPVRAKAEGHQPDGMDAETAALFPDSFEDSELGEIPAGWGVSTIGEEVKVVGGGTPSTKEPDFWENGVYNWVTPKDLSRLSQPILLDSERKITEAGLRVISSGLLPIGTVLLSSRAPIGYLAIAEVPTAINQGFIAMICDNQLPNLWVLRWTESNIELIKGQANGTTFLEVSKGAFRPLPVIVPSQAVLNAYMNVVCTLHQRLILGEREILALTATRDALLPKFMAGEFLTESTEEM
jgi:type I restriction enzyme S subunit